MVTLRKLSLHKLFFVLLAIAFAGSFLCSAKKSSWDDDARRRKASYLYIEAIEAFMDENYNLYGELLNRAYSLDPDDPELKMRVGEWTLLTNPNDSAAIEKGFQMLFEGYRQKPADYFEGNQMLSLTSNYRRWDDNLRAAEMMAWQFPDRNEVKLQLGRSYLVKAMTGDTSYIRRAVDIFSGLEDRVGKSAQLSDLKIRAFAISGDTAAIVRELGELYSASPEDSYTALAVGQIFGSLQRPDSALRYLDRACELDSTNGNAILMRAQFLQEQGDSAAFEREALRAIKSPDLEFESKMKFVVNYIHTYANDSAQQPRIDSLFETLLDVNSGEPDVYRLYAEYLASRQLPLQAAEQMDYVVSLDPSDPGNWLFQAQMYVTGGDFKAAADVLSDASKIFPGDLTFIRPEAVYRSLSGDTDEAIRLLENYPDSTITNQETLSEFKSMLGDFYYQKHRRDDAFAAYEEALNANPYNYMAMNNVAYYYAETDTLLDKAESYARRVVRHEPDNTTYLDTYAWVLYKKGDYEAAREQIDKTLELVVFDSSIDSIDATIHEIETGGKPASDTPQDVVEETVSGTTQEAAPVNSGSAELFDHAGDIYFRCGKIDEAVDYWKKALDRNPDDSDRIKAKIKNRKIIENEL